MPCSFETSVLSAMTHFARWRGQRQSRGKMGVSVSEFFVGLFVPAESAMCIFSIPSASQSLRELR